MEIGREDEIVFTWYRWYVSVIKFSREQTSRTDKRIVTW
jgi:hypothetical protein